MKFWTSSKKGGGRAVVKPSFKKKIKYGYVVGGLGLEVLVQIVIYKKVFFCISEQFLCFYMLQNI